MPIDETTLQLNWKSDDLKTGFSETFIVENVEDFILWLSKMKNL